MEVLHNYFIGGYPLPLVPTAPYMQGMPPGIAPMSAPLPAMPPAYGPPLHTLEEWEALSHPHALEEIKVLDYPSPQG